MRLFYRLYPVHNTFRTAVISSGRNPVYAKQKLSPLRSRGRLFLCLVLLTFLVAFPGALRADSLEDAARALARKVVANHKKNLGSSYVWENHASVSLATSERMREAFEVELERLLRIRVDHVEQASTSILITESASQIHLLAKDSSQGGDIIDSVTLPKGQFASIEGAGTVLKLDRQILWQQPESMLDLAVSNDPSGKPEILVVLGRESLSLYTWIEGQWVRKNSTSLPHSKTPLRDLRGEIHIYDHFFQFHLPGMECDGDAWQKLTFECEEQTGIWHAEVDFLLPFSLDAGRNFFAIDPHYIGPKKSTLSGFFSVAPYSQSRPDFQDQETLAGADGHAYIYLSGNEREKIPEYLERLPVNWGSDLAQFSVNCREGSLVLASGARDHSSRDTLQGFEVEPRTVTPVTATAEFPGPILSLKNTDDSEAIAIVFNLTTGNYEAYRVTVECDD
jgi:hypothetical protein